MHPASDRSYSRRDTVLFVACLALSVAALFFPEQWTVAFAGGLRATVLRPFVWLQERAEEGKTSRARLRAVTAERDSAAYVAQFLPSLTAENERLRHTLGLSRRLTAPYVPAEVLHQAQVTDARMLLLSVGRSSGVSTFDPIVAPEGLVGVVWSVGPATSVAMTWAHPEFRVSAFAENGSAYGIVAPSASATGSDAFLELRGVPYRDSVAIGTIVLSSGLGGVYPKGIPIGTVVGVESEQAGWERVYRVRPAANPGSISHVLVLTAPPHGSVADAFPPDSAEPTPRLDSLPALRVRPGPPSGRKAAAGSAPAASQTSPAATPSPAAMPTPTPVRIPAPAPPPPPKDSGR